MQPLKNAQVDVILDVLKAANAHSPASGFVSSLLLQYQERGFLTKRQLEGLHSKASKIKDLAPGKLATLEAIILKLPTRYKQDPAPTVSPIYEEVIPIRIFIAAILEKVPGHKRVMEFKEKHKNNVPLTTHEITELQRFYKMFVHKGASKEENAK